MLLYIPINAILKTISNKMVGFNEINISCHAPISKNRNHIKACHVKATGHATNISCDSLFFVG
jgi:hypothetical protein